MPYISLHLNMLGSTPMKNVRKIFYIFFYFIVFILSSCAENHPAKNEVIIHELADAEMLNPVNYTDANAGYIMNHIFQKLIDADFRNPSEFVPVLAESRPMIEKTPEGKMRLTFKIRKEAKWDNGSDVTAKDVDFTLKTNKNLLVNNPNQKSYFDFIVDFKYFDDDPKKFSVIADTIYFMAEATFTDVAILPEYVYDPKGLMKKFSIKQLSSKSDSLKTDPQIKEFADDFNSGKRMRDPNFIGGSGAYKFSEWKTNDYITLTKKEDWWGRALNKENCFFEATPSKLTFKIISDQASALVSLKAGNLDVMNGIKSNDFNDLPRSEKFTKNFNAYTPMEYSYVYIGLNTKSPVLSDKLTRQAISYITDADNIIKTIKYGQAEPIIGPIHPSKKKTYNSDIQRYTFDPGKAKELLAKAGWKNTNGDETLDKMIDGKRTEFIVDFLFNAGNDERKSIALLIQDEAKKIGIKMNVQSIDWSVYLQKCRNHQFDMMIGKWIGGPGPDDLKQTFHSSSATGEGSNYCSFSNPQADALMDSIRYEIDEVKRNKMYDQVQEILHDEAPMIFLYSPAERIAISKKFDNAYPSVTRPGYWVEGFQIKTASPQ